MRESLFSYTLTWRSRVKLWFLVTCAGLFAFATCAIGAKAPTVRVVVAQQSGDTLHFSPSAHQIVAGWNADSLDLPHYYCVAAYAEWPRYFYVRHMYRRPPDLRCAPPMPLFIQARVCPEGSIAFSQPTGATWIVVQCSMTRFESYRVPARPAPRTDNGGRV